MRAKGAVNVFTTKLKSPSIMLAIVISGCSGSGGGSSGCGGCGSSGSLALVAPSILPSLPNTTGINYVAVYNQSNATLSGLSYTLSQNVGSGNSITLDSDSAMACATISPEGSCYLKLSVPESTIAGGAVISAINNGTAIANPQAIGVQQIAYNELVGADGVGLYFYNKVQYTAGGAPYILITAVVQSANANNINTIELVDQNGNLISGQVTISGNSGHGKALLQKGSVVTIALPVPQGAGLTQTFKVQASYQTIDSASLGKIAQKLNSKKPTINSTTNTSTGTTAYVVTTQSDNINLQLTPDQVFLTAGNPIQYGYLYNTGSLTASQIQIASVSPNVTVSTADTVLNGQKVVQVTYQLQNTSVTPSANVVYTTGQNPSGQSQISFGQANQNIYPNESSSPSPSPSPGPGPSPAPEQLSVVGSPAPQAGGTCSTITVTTPTPVSVSTLVTVSVENNSTYGFAQSASGPYSLDTSCTINAGQSSCSTSSGASNNLCVASSVASATQVLVAAAASGYTSNSTSLTVAPGPLTLNAAISQRPYAGGNCGVITATTSQPVSGNTTVNFSTTGGSGAYGFGAPYTASYISSASCDIPSGSVSCSTTNSNSLCATTSVSAATPISVTATASGGYSSATANTTVTARYMYMAVGGSGVTQCLIRESDGSPVNCSTQDDPQTSVDLGFVALTPNHKYMYLLSTHANNNTPEYYTCLMNESGTYNNSNCQLNNNFYGYAQLAFAPTGNTMFAYLAGVPGASTAGSLAPSYCSIYQESSLSLLCSQPSSSGTTSSSGGVVSLELNGSNYIYVLPYQNNGATSIYQCNVTSSPGYGSNCRYAFTTGASSTAGGNIRSLAFTHVGSSYFAYLSTIGSPDNSIYFFPVTESGLIVGNATNLNGSKIYEDGTFVSSATNLGATNLNNKPYLYFATTAIHTVVYCPINTESGPDDKIVGDVGDDQNRYSCIESSIQNDPTTSSSPPSTVVSSITFGTW